MTWYVAHVIMSLKKIGGKQKNIPVYENLILVEGITEEEAFQKVSTLAKEEAKISSDGLSLNDKPAKMVFEGIRKLIRISNPYDMDLDTVPPCSGTELTYSEYLVKSRTQLKKMAQGKAVKLLYKD